MLTLRFFEESICKNGKGTLKYTLKIGKNVIQRSLNVWNGAVPSDMEIYSCEYMC